MKDNVFYPLILQCQCYDPASMMVCVCPQNEKALRAYSKQDACSISFKQLPKMTEKQREWCLSEIDQVEGYNRNEHTLATDSDLARTVLDAWTDYCRDKGML